MNNKKEKILSLVAEYINEKNSSKSWKKGEDWVEYSGPNCDDKEFVAAIDNLLEGWFIFGKKGREFELEFPQHLGMKHGALANSGSSANLLMVAAAIQAGRIPNFSMVLSLCLSM